MPLYEYQCTKCSERAEVIQRVSDPPYSHCPKCGGDMRKLISSPAIQFKGSGFYKTDYANKGRSGGDGKKGESSEAKSETQSESKSETQSDSKSEAKSESKTETKSETKSESKGDTSSNSAKSSE